MASSHHLPAEILGEVAPDAVDVSAAVARVVELQEEGRPFQAVVMRPARLDAASPAEARLLDAGAADAVVHWRGDTGRQDAEVGFDDLDHERTLSVVKIAGRNADRVERADVGLVLGHVLRQSSALKDRRL